MRGDYTYFLKQYEQIESHFLKITNFTGFESDLEAPCYKQGSNELNDFCIKIGTEVETVFKVILFSTKFEGIRKKGDEKSINKYRPLIENEYHLSNYEILVKPINKKIKPFQDFNLDRPAWFRIYSKYKHDKLELKKLWNLKHSLFALGCLLLLVINHPELDGKCFKKNEVSQKVFSLLDSKPSYAGAVSNVETSTFYKCRKCGTTVSRGMTVEVIVGAGSSVEKCPNCKEPMEKI